LRTAVRTFRGASICARAGFYVVLLCAAFVPSGHTEDLETSDQVWMNFVMASPRSEKLYLEYDIEAAKQVSGGDPWHYLYGTGVIEYYPIISST